MACGNTWDLPEGDPGQFSVDPLADDVHHPWELRKLPTFSWTSQHNDFYTLIMYDVGYFVPHAIYVNIRSNDIAHAEVHFMNPTPNGPQKIYLSHFERCFCP